MDQPVIEPFVAAHQEYVAALASLGAPLELEQRAVTAYAEYAEALTAAASVPVEVEERIAKAFDTYREVLHETLATDGVRGRFDEAHRTYLEAVRDAWLSVDIDQLDPPAVASISSSMNSVALMAAAAEPPAS